MSQYININSQLDALKLKEFEKIFYENINEDVKVVPKVTPFKGINTDLLYVKDGRILFIKFMDTTEDIFFILEEELLEVMNEEYELLKLKMGQKNRNISYNYVYIMPYVEVEETYEFEEFVNNNIIDKNKLQDIMNKGSLEEYLNDENDEINLNLFLLDICSEYYIINDKLHLNEKFKKISFYNDDYKYTATMMEDVQIKDVVSIKYGNTLIEGGSGIGKTAIMLSRAIKLAKVYPHHKLVIFTHTKQLCNELRERIELLYKDNNNLEVHTFSSFIFKLAKKFNLIVDYNMLKNDYEKTFNNLVKQAQNIIKNKNMFKAIFIDEAESFLEYEIDFIREFLYKTKFIFNVCSCNSLNISNRLNIFKKLYNGIEFDDKIILSKNYRQAKEIVDFTNKFSNNSNSYINELRPNDYSEVAIVYPYNKKKLKSGKTIYFQYMLKKALEEAKIPYICAEDNLTNISKKVGTTIANIYAIKNLEYKAVIVCELEMLYNQTINDIEQDYQVNDFVGDLNKVYLAMSRATDYLSIVTTFNEEASDILQNQKIFSKKIFVI